MVGYTEVLQTIGAMVIFSLILLSATRMIQRNTLMQVEGELEQEVVALAQDIIEEGRTKEFDEYSVSSALPPADANDFAAPSNLGPDSGENTRQDFDDFDDYHDWEEVIETEHGEFNIRTEVFYVNDSFNKTASPTYFKKMQVFITSKFLKQGSSGEMTEYRLEFTRNYYAD
ncbi:hypothetical protein LQ318_06950 [Aliifodinibius salicampi]|uniref:Uncharacterized protein n=1 Tax=Fodinibius salicampi TaxID=1920655 RepID=A0ABT3PXS6_9BACT|nr:hypothetical protein [Fodinibius salicampi]MCW9712637.1 hypothetical protein [Fodinibius salicampi]